VEASKVDAFINRMINESRKKAKLEQNKQQAIKLKTHKIPLSKKLEQNTFENFKPITGKKIALDTFMAYAQEFDNKKDGLLLMGETGRGKTHLISALYNKMHEQGRLVIFGNIIKAGWTDNVILVYADDGGFSGYHFDSYLYGLDRKTGKKLWPYYLSHKGMSFYCIIENHLFYRWFSIMQQWPVLLLRKTGHFKFAWQRIRLDSQDRSFNWGKNLFCFYVF